MKAILTIALLQKRYQDQQKIKPLRIKFLPPGPITVPISQLQDIPSYFFVLLMSVFCCLQTVQSCIWRTRGREGATREYPF